MAYNFHYTPTGTGVISGKEVLEQTEDAINDLGNTAISGVQEALDKAEQALTNSANAVDDAQTALNTANNAEGVAIQAQTDVGNLSGTVANIGNRVTTAEGNITNLQGRMTTAEGSISGLNTRMGTAEGNITTLQSNVSTAQATANSAQQTANTARQQSYVFRYSSSSVTDNSTIAYSTLDNTDNIKAGDKVIDVDGKIFSVVSVDTANQTVTVGSALIDLALDANVVHTSGNETVGGQKTFSDDLLIYNTDNSVDTPRLNIKTSKYVKGDTTNTDTMRINFVDSNGNNVASVYAYKNTGGSQYLSFQVYTTDNNNVNITSSINYYISKSGDRFFVPYEDGQISLGGNVRRWKSIYATNYYYGSNNVEFSTKFVTTDTNQTVSGAKTFTSVIKGYNSDSTQNTVSIDLRTSKVARGSTSDGTDNFGIGFKDKANVALASINCIKRSTGGISEYHTIYSTDSDNNVLSESLSFNLGKDGACTFRADTNNKIILGTSSNRWRDVQTNQINGLTPSSLGMPSTTEVVDISGYITDLTGTANTYTVLVNGYIQFDVTGSSVEIDVTNGLSQKWIMTDPKGFIPVVSGASVSIKVVGTAINNFKFIPCQGNI